jgi:hypothetical protein
VHAPTAIYREYMNDCGHPVVVGVTCEEWVHMGQLHLGVAAKNVKLHVVAHVVESVAHPHSISTARLLVGVTQLLQSALCLPTPHTRTVSHKASWLSGKGQKL